MEPRISAVTLGVADLGRALAFYRDGLGWATESKVDDGVVFFQLNGMVLSLFPTPELAADAGVSGQGTGFPRLTIAHIVRSEADVDRTLAEAERAGARITRPGSKAFWGGYTGYFADPDGHLWEVAFNPHWSIDARGNIDLG